MDLYLTFLVEFTSLQSAVVVDGVVDEVEVELAIAVMVEDIGTFAVVPNIGVRDGAVLGLGVVGHGLD